MTRSGTEQHPAKRGLARRASAPGLAAIALTLAISGCGATNESATTSSGATQLTGKVDGAGSSAQDSAMDAWRAGFQKGNSDLTVNYDPSGSGAGVEKFLAGGVDFAGTDAALDQGELAAARKRCGAEAIEVPNYVSPIAVVFNLDGVDELRLTARTLAQVFAGTITTWDDPAIEAANPDADLPATRIDAVHRSDESGTTENFTDYLHTAGRGAWSPSGDKSWPLKSGEAANQTSGMIAAVQAGKGTIGYADLSQVGELSTAAIRIGDQWELPSAKGAAAAIASSPLVPGRPANSMAVEIDRTTTTRGAYPLMLTSYLVACPSYDPAKAKLVQGFLTYVLSEPGQQEAAANSGSAPLPVALADQARTIVSSITSN